MFRKALAALLSASLALLPGVSSAAQAFAPSGKGKGVEVFASAPPAWKGPMKTLLLSPYANSLSVSLPSIKGLDLDDAGAYASLAPVLQNLEARHGLEEFERLSPVERVEAFQDAVNASKASLAKEAGQLRKKAAALLFDPTQEAEVVAKLGMLQTTLAPYLEDETLDGVREAYKIGFERLSQNKKAQVQRALEAMAAGLGGGTLAEALDQGAVSASGPPSKKLFAKLGRFFKGGKEQPSESVPTPKAKPAVVLKVQEKWRDFKELLRRTSAEVFIGIGVVALTGTFLAHHHEETRTHVIPLGFSEVHQIERDLEKQGKTLGPTARYLTSVNDLTMKVFETWNDSWEQTYAGDNVHKFAFLLDMRMDPAMKFHKYEVYDYLKTLPAESQAVLDQLKPFIEVRDGVRTVAGHLDRAWDESHVDNYHTEWYYETVADNDEDGGTHQELRSKQVYDNTTHTYTYYADQGNAASSKLDKLLAEHPELRFDEQLATASQTNAEGEYAAQKSRKKDGKESWTSDDYQRIADRWKDGSTLVQNLPDILGLYSGVEGDAGSWRAAKRTAHSDSYITTSSYDSGPHELQVAETAADRAHALDARITEVIDGVEFVKTNTPLLESKIKELIAVELEHKKGGESPKKLVSEIMELSRQFYGLNMKAGFEVDRYRWWVVLLGLAFGALGGGLLGKLWDYLGARYGWYNSRRSKETP